MKSVLSHLQALLIPLCLMTTNCAQNTASDIQLLPEENFNQTIDGKQVSLYTLKAGDLTMQLTNFGGRIISLWTPDKNGVMADVEIGYDKLDTYINNPGERFLGAAVGPVANRIGKGTFTLDGVTYNTPLNNDGNTLHGGFKGIDMIVWDVVAADESSITLAYTHPDGEEGFPGNLAMTMKYSLTADNEFKVEYSATTDKATPVNLSHHSFFNLHGAADQCINDHILMINAGATTPIDNLLIPDGTIASVEGTAFDFRKAHAIGDMVDSPELANGRGYDNNWVLTRETANQVELAATVEDPVSGRFMEVYTDQPGLQFYGGNFFDGTTKDKYGKDIIYRGSIALEAQNFPDAINNASFPDSVLKPGETYTSTTIYKFSVKQ